MYLVGHVSIAEQQPLHQSFNRNIIRPNIPSLLASIVCGSEEQEDVFAEAPIFSWHQGRVRQLWSFAKHIYEVLTHPADPVEPSISREPEGSAARPGSTPTNWHQIRMARRDRPQPEACGVPRWSGASAESDQRERGEGGCLWQPETTWSGCSFSLVGQNQCGPRPAGRDEDRG